MRLSCVLSPLFAVGLFTSLAFGQANQVERDAAAAVRARANPAERAKVVADRAQGEPTERAKAADQRAKQGKSAPKNNDNSEKPTAVDRLRMLREKSRTGKLTPAEQAEMDAVLKARGAGRQQSNATTPPS